MPQEIVRTIRIETQRSENSINSLNKEIKDLKKALGDLTIGTEEYIRVQTELADKQSRLKEINSSLKAEARTTVRRLETMQRSASGLASAYSALNAAMALSGKAGANFEKTLTKIQSGIAIAQGLGGLKDFIQEIPNLIDDFKNLGNVVASFFGKFNKSLDPLDSRLSKTAEKLTGLKVPEAGKETISASASAGSGNKVIVQQTQALAQQQRTIVPLNEQWNKYIENQKEVLTQANARLRNTEQSTIIVKKQIAEYQEAKKVLEDLNRVMDAADAKSGDPFGTRMGASVEELREAAKELGYDYDELFNKSQKILKSNKLGEAGIRNYEDLKKALEGLEKQYNEASKEAENAKKNIDNVKESTEQATTATSGLNKAWGAFKSVLSTVGWTVLISFLVSAVYKLIDWAKAAIKAADAQRELNKEINKSTASLSSSKLAAFYELAEAYKQVGDAAKSKEEFLKTYREEIDNTGLAIDNLNQADEAFINNTERYVQAIIARAKVDAYKEQITKKTKETLEENLELERKLNSGEAGQLNKTQLFSLSAAEPTQYAKLSEEYKKANIQAVKEQIESNDKALDDFVKDAVVRIGNLKLQFEDLWKKEKKPETGSGSKVEVKSETDPLADYKAFLEASEKELLDSLDKQLAELDDKYRDALSIASERGDELLTIEQAYLKEKSDILNKYYSDKNALDAQNASKEAQEEAKRKEAITKQYQEQLSSIIELYDNEAKQIESRSTNFYHFDPFGFKWQKRSDVEAEFNANIQIIDDLYKNAVNRLNAEKNQLNIELADPETDISRTADILARQLKIEEELREASRERDLKAEEAAAQKKQKIWQAYTATVQAGEQMFSGIVDIAMAERGEEAKVTKGFMAAQAVFSALNAANGAYSAMASIPYVGPVLGAIAAASALASGYANVRMIYKTDESGKNINTSTPNTVQTAPVSYTKELLGDKEKEMINQPQIVCVVEDINNMQNRVKVKEANSSF